jgi:hypothetical protein
MLQPQVLASIQLDATLASIKQEARHDGVLAERMAHWTAVFRERGGQCVRLYPALSHMLAAADHALLWGGCTACICFENNCQHHNSCWTCFCNKTVKLFTCPCQVLSWRRPLHPGRRATTWQQCCPQASLTVATP